MYSASLQKCDCLPNYIRNITSGLCYSSSNPTPSTCPAGQVYNAASNQCVTPSICPAGQVYNPISNKCVISTLTCPAGQVFDSASNKCVSTTPIPTTCLINQYYDAGSQKCICISGFTMTNGQCLAICKTYEIFNPSTNKCDCINSYYRDATGNCIYNSSYTNSNSNSTTTNTTVQCFSGTKLNTATNQCDCLTNYVRRSDNKSCILCDPTYTYNPASDKCEKTVIGCPPGYTLNANQTLCLSQWSYTTNWQTSNLITSNMSSYQSAYNANHTNSQYVQDCNGTSPFYDFNHKTCVSCPSTQPYFNLDTYLCQDCGGGSYNAASYSCSKNGGAGGNLVYNPTL